MPSSSIEQTRAAFEASIPAWRAYTESARGKLRQAMILRHVQRHLTPGGHILDVGGGTGELAAELARAGHRVTLLDSSPAMLAEAKQLCGELASGISFVCADADDIQALFPGEEFDAVLCHSLLEFVSEPQDVIEQLARLLRRPGVLSVVVGNRYHTVLRAAVVMRDIPRACEALDREPVATDLFGLPLRTFYPDTLRELLERSGLEVTGEYGVRVFADLAEGLMERPEELLALELAASARLPYRRLARFIQLIAEKR